ncbi:hypothetical protein ACLN6N_12550 [Sphingomonas carotinifaciens]|uniref:hypothetical protein n=1 Tax=Sphingomonas carotinifaciens TaxID=1166323 RepID=UPI0039A3E363
MRGMHGGDVTVDRDGTFRGMVMGNLTVASGCTVDVAAMIQGDVVVGAGADVCVTGMVMGRVVNRGGRVRVEGMVSG